MPQNSKISYTLYPQGFTEALPCMVFAQKFQEIEFTTTTHSDYEHFGMSMEGRTFESTGYKFGFQGQESEDELYGEGNASFFKYRISDNRLGRFFSIDPLAAKYPHNSPYAFSENKVVAFRELEGLESSTATIDFNDDKPEFKTETWESIHKGQTHGPLGYGTLEVIINEDGSRTENYEKGLGDYFLFGKLFNTNKGNNVVDNRSFMDKAFGWLDGVNAMTQGNSETEGTWVDEHIGKPVGKFMASINPLVAIPNAAISLSPKAKTDVFEDKLTVGNRILNVAGALPLLSPFSRIAKTGRLGATFDGKLLDKGVETGLILKGTNDYIIKPQFDSK